MSDDATYRAMKQQRDAALAECERFRAALEETRKCLGDANEAESSPICDTIWYSDSETLFDFIDAAIDAARAKP